MSGILFSFIHDVTLYRLKLAAAGSATVFLIDLYVFRSVYYAFKNHNSFLRNGIYGVHWLLSIGIIITIVWYRLGDVLNYHSIVREWIVGWMLIIYGSKLIACIILFYDDARRFFNRLLLKRKKNVVAPDSPAISRSEFLMKTAVVAGAVPFTALSFGIIHGAHDYRVIRETITLPDLPKSLHGLRIGQISDIHAGTLFNKTAVRGGIDLLLNEKTDIIFFTGDLIDYFTRELNDWINVFAALKAPLGVYSITGNHDYGDYNWWPNEEAKQNEFNSLVNAHRLMGYELLLNKNKIIGIGNEQLAIIGVENWSLKRDRRYGNIDQAVKGTEDVPVKLLLSHDPTHWDAEVRTRHPEIQVTFSGHTHGGQLGVEVGKLRVSPAQFRFKQWAGLYQENDQYLYVNRGFGCLGYPGRIGMPPELTVVELKRG